MNVDVYNDIINVLDKKLNETFKKHLELYEKEEKIEELKMLNELKLLNIKIDKLSNQLENISVKPAIAENPLSSAQGQPTKSKSKIIKTEEIFIPTLDNNTSIINRSNVNKQIKDNNINDNLSTLNNLK